MKKKVLQISHKPAFPKLDGGSMGIYKSLKFLQKKYITSTFVFFSTKHKLDIPSYKKNFNLNDIYYQEVFLNFNLIISIYCLIFNKSYNLYRFKNQLAKKKLIKIIKENKYDIIVFESIYASIFIDEIRNITKAKLILNCPNIENIIWYNLANELKINFIKKTYLKILYKQLKKEENKLLQQFDGIICTTNIDKEYILENTSNKNIFIKPYLIDFKNINVYEKQSTSKIKLYHFGAMDWLPNVNGIKWFLENVWKKIYKTNKFELVLAGKNMPKEILQWNNLENTKVHSFIENIENLINNSDVLIVPIFSSSGIRVKIIEAFAYAKCVISTNEGIKGISAKVNEHYLNANNSDEFISQLYHIYNNSQFAINIGNNARNHCNEYYNENEFEDKLIEFYNKI